MMQEPVLVPEIKEGSEIERDILKEYLILQWDIQEPFALHISLMWVI